MGILATVMYVNDTDWLQLGKSPRMSDDDLVAQVQLVTTDAGMLSQATGGALKQEKCSAYFMCWRFVRGQPRLKRTMNCHILVPKWNRRTERWPPHTL